MPRRTVAPSHAQEVYDKQTRQRSYGLKSAQDVRNSSFWKKVRKTYASLHPLCEDPHGDHKNDYMPPVVADVHHIIPIQKAPHLAFKHSNLMSVCKDCHAVFSQQERNQP